MDAVVRQLAGQVKSPRFAVRPFSRHTFKGMNPQVVAFTPEQQFRLLQVALRVKLRREGAAADAVRLALSKLEVAEQPTLALAA